MKSTGFPRAQVGTLDRGNANGYDQLCAAIWVANTTIVAGKPTPTALETYLRTRFPDELGEENSGNLARYAARTAIPFRRDKKGSPRIRLMEWPKRAQQLWPGTVDWLVTPFWYLAGNTPDSRQLLECVSLLPANFRHLLLEDGYLASEDVPELALIPREFVYELTVPLGPFALGALYCALRYARLAGDLYSERWCWVGIAWALLEMERISQEPLRTLLAELATLHLLSANDRMLLPGMPAPLPHEAVELFQRERETFLGWTVEGQIAAGLTPTWVESKKVLTPLRP
jgi:hypothetical protein